MAGISSKLGRGKTRFHNQPNRAGLKYFMFVQKISEQEILRVFCWNISAIPFTAAVRKGRNEVENAKTWQKRAFCWKWVVAATGRCLEMIMGRHGEWRRTNVFCRILTVVDRFWCACNVGNVHFWTRIKIRREHRCFHLNKTCNAPFSFSSKKLSEAQRSTTISFFEDFDRVKMSVSRLGGIVVNARDASNLIFSQYRGGAKQSI